MPGKRRIYPVKVPEVSNSLKDGLSLNWYSIRYQEYLEKMRIAVGQPVPITPGWLPDNLDLEDPFDVWQPDQSLLDWCCMDQSKCSITVVNETPELGSENCSGYACIEGEVCCYWRGLMAPSNESQYCTTPI